MEFHILKRRKSKVDLTERTLRLLPIKEEEKQEKPEEE